MPAFDLQLSVSGGAVLSAGQWTDPAGGTDPTAPSRVNARPGSPLIYTRVTPGTLTFKALVDGVLAPLDSNPVMAGETFQVWWVVYQSGSSPAISQPAGQSSQADCTMLALGHHCLGFRTPQRGALLYHFDVIAP